MYTGKMAKKAKLQLNEKPEEEEVSTKEQDLAKLVELATAVYHANLQFNQKVVDDGMAQIYSKIHQQIMFRVKAKTNNPNRYDEVTQEVKMRIFEKICEGKWMTAGVQVNTFIYNQIDWCLGDLRRKPYFNDTAHSGTRHIGSQEAEIKKSADDAGVELSESQLCAEVCKKFNMGKKKRAISPADYAAFKAGQNPVSLTDTITSGGSKADSAGHPGSIQEIVPDKTVDVQAQVESGGIKRIMAAIKKLDPNERTAIIGVRIHGFTCLEISKKLGVSESRVSQIITGALPKLQLMLESDDLETEQQVALRKYKKLVPKLTKDQRVVAYSILYGHSIEETAELTGKSYQGVRLNLNKGLKALEELYNKSKQTIADSEN
jgi:RNA polymerase sigma factor (sigma-70 family)